MTRCLLVVGKIFTDDFFALPGVVHWGPFRIKGVLGRLAGFQSSGTPSFTIRFRKTSRGWVTSHVDLNPEIWACGKEGAFLSWLEKRFLPWEGWNKESASGHSGIQRMSLGLFPVMGTYYRVSTPIRLQSGDTLVLAHQEDNAFDPWAVEVRTLGGQILGYLPRLKNEVIARLIQGGKRLSARVVNWDGKRMGIEVFLLENK